MNVTLKNVKFYSERLIIGAWLLFLYASALWLVLATLVSFQFQTEFSNDTSEEEVLEAIVVQNRISDLEFRLLENQRSLENVDYKISSLSAERDTSSLSDPDYKKKITGQIVSSEMVKISLNSRRRDIVKNLSELNKSAIFTDSPEYQRIREAAADLKYMQAWGFAQIALMPSTFLTLLLTISMGAFGSVIHLTWEYFDKEKQKQISWYIFRPFLGAVLAFAIFILLKSGQMILTNTTGSGDVEIDLNPYFISFLAIVSGILSEQAYAKITSAGSQFFTPPEQERWIRGGVAKEVMNKRDLDAEDLGQFLGMPRKKTVQAWLDGENPLSERQQEIVSAWLGVMGRELFTDQPPSADKAPETGLKV